LTGQATAVTKWEWNKPFTDSGMARLFFSKASLSVAGLNQPLNIFEAAMGWNDGRRAARLLRVEALEECGRET